MPHIAGGPAKFQGVPQTHQCLAAECGLVEPSQIVEARGALVANQGLTQNQAQRIRIDLPRPFPHQLFYITVQAQTSLLPHNYTVPTRTWHVINNSEIETEHAHRI